MRTLNINTDSLKRILGLGTMMIGVVGCADRAIETEVGKGALPVIEVVAQLETAPSSLMNADADDPAFWIHPSDPSKNMVIACQKEGGYSVYDVNGKTLVDGQPGRYRFNNVEVLKGFPLDEGATDLAVMSDRVTDNLVFFAISEAAPYLRMIETKNEEPLFSGVAGEATAYGLGAYEDSEDGQFYAVVTQNDFNRVRMVRLKAEGKGIRWETVHQFELGGGGLNDHAEGVVFDPKTRRLYIVQEEIGVYSVELDGLDPKEERVLLGADDLLFKAGDYGLTPDVEGIDWVDDGEVPGWLIVSSQGNNQFLVFERMSLEAVAQVRVVASDRFDGSEHCDGLAVISERWGPQFPHGVLIVHDGDDTPNVKLPEEQTNFKWVRWELIRDQLRKD